MKTLFDELIASAVPERNITINVVDCEPGLEIEADEKVLVSAVSNILQNAVKFTRQNGKIEIRAFREQPHGEHGDALLVIEVEDECGGLSSDIQEELFQPFVQRGQGQAPPSNRRRGLGLGLAITREAVERHDGKLSVRNRPEKGCVFAIRLPEKKKTNLQ